MRSFVTRPGPLEDRDVLLHRREAHGVVPGKLGHALPAIDRPADDVAPGGVREGAEHAVEVGWGYLHSYNHTVVSLHCQAARRPGIAAVRTGGRHR